MKEKQWKLWTFHFRFNHTHVVEWLLDEAKVDSSQRAASGAIPLHFAVVGGDTDIVKLLLEEDPS